MNISGRVLVISVQPNTTCLTHNTFYSLFIIRPILLLSELALAKDVDPAKGVVPDSATKYLWSQNV